MTLTAAAEANGSVNHHATTLPILPNYISNPPFPYASGSNDSFQANEVCAVPSSHAAGKCIIR